MSLNKNSGYCIFSNNKINARSLIGQSAMVYCAGKNGKIEGILNYYIKVIDHKFLWFIG